MPTQQKYKLFVLILLHLHPSVCLCVYICVYIYSMFVCLCGCVCAHELVYLCLSAVTRNYLAGVCTLVRVFVCVGVLERAVSLQLARW